jgi:hypothetical protein
LSAFSLSSRYAGGSAFLGAQSYTESLWLSRTRPAHRRWILKLDFLDFQLENPIFSNVVTVAVFRGR